MENVLRYYEFSSFKKDESNTFNNNDIAYTILNETHFLIFEKQGETYNLYVAKYQNEKEIGLKPPQILETLIIKYDKSIPEHRLAIKQYLY